MQRFWPVLTTTLATFFAVLALLAFQLRTGHDPALGRGTTALLAPGAHGSRLVSRTSGAAQHARPGSPAAAVAPLSSHTSGAAGSDD